LRTEFGRTLLANSITLTPGTLTLEVGDEGIFTVHALTIAAARDVVEWPLIKWLHMLEG
jgi:multicomponent Na+:H+ antiporter subunit E